MRLRTKIYFGLTGANILLAGLSAIVGSMYLLVIGVLAGMFCNYVAHVWLDEDLTKLLDKENDECPL